jgi:hypothetical protein
VNKYQEHVFVLPEDEADRELANGFALGLAPYDNRIQVLREEGGWGSVVDKFKRDHVKPMRNYDKRYMVLLLDFDRYTDWCEKVRDSVPEDLVDRVFVLGVDPNPEALQTAELGTNEKVGMTLAEECRTGAEALWVHDLLKHNAGELKRMIPTVKQILFPQ